MLRTLLLFSGVFLFVESSALHLRGGQITAARIGCSLTYEIKLTLYLNSSTLVKPEGGVLDFGDGNKIILPNLDETLIDSVNNISVAVFKASHTFSGSGIFIVSYTEGNRNAGVLNLSNSVDTPFHIETLINADPAVCGHQIQFTIPPIDRACSGFIFTYNPGTVVPPGDSVSYELVPSLQGNGVQVDGYLFPNAPKFYPNDPFNNIEYQKSNEAMNGPPTISIDANGTLTWDAPRMQGEYSVAIKVILWMKQNDQWVLSSWVLRDMQILVEDCHVQRPVLEVPNDKCIWAGTSFHQTIKAHDADGLPVIIETTSINGFSTNAPIFKNVSVWQTADTANLKINWTPDCDQVRNQPYSFIFKISVLTKNGIRISTYYTWKLKVVGPPPVYKDLSLDVSKKTLAIQWNFYPCSNISSMQIWRRVDKTNVNLDSCTTGIPRSQGFSKIGESTNGNFTDNTLSAGATYCYRLVALFNFGNRVYSLASKDTCIGPLKVDAPVLTKVSVEKTDLVQGRILLSWLSPFQINKKLFPPPYVYDLLQTKNGKDFLKLNSTKIQDTTYQDLNLNSADSLYGYRVIVYSPTSIAKDNPIDTSSIAFYPRLKYEPLKDSIRLFWSAQTPWSNQSVRYPYHYIYRKELTDTQFQMMDSIDVNKLAIEEGFEYFDFGKVPGFAIQPNTIYQYKIETQGTYGNKLIAEPLQNFSNEINAQPIDNQPPCAVTLSVQGMSCDAVRSMACSNVTYKNLLEWIYPTTCGNDIDYFKIFYSETDRSDSILIASTSTATFQDVRQNSFAGCYRVVAVDRSGNQSTAQKVCIENCQSIFLPNVVTVNDDGANEIFPGFSDSNQQRDPSTCSRFIKNFSIQIFNRWGTEVFIVTNATPENSNYEWKGLDTRGQELPVGVYYYSASINFYSSDPKAPSQTFKGWVNLIR